jgi:hypothetical protein
VQTIIDRVLVLLVGTGLAFHAPAQSPATAPGSLQFSAADYTIGENSGIAIISVTRVNGASGPVSVGCAAGAGTATAGGDFAPASGTLQWGDGEMGARTFFVGVASDSLVEGGETVLLTLRNPAGGATLGAFSRSPTSHCLAASA